MDPPNGKGNKNNWQAKTIKSKRPVWKERRAPGYFLYFSAPQRVLLQFVVRGNLLDGLVVHSSPVSHTPVPSCFPRCHPLSPPRTPRVTPPTPVGPGTPPAAPKQVSHRRFRLWSAPNPASAPRCSPLLVAPPQYTLNLRSAVGRDPRRPPMPGFPAPAYVASAPRAFRISAASIPHAPNKPAKALVKARSRHHTGRRKGMSGCGLSSGAGDGAEKMVNGTGIA
ncbi:hypothetical protein PGTUg99_036081 [Puccinia graminis f. sp. tritici]|uniref:Uncharacterized protein n=1 Tax=Puccinia graminis f. sp. tritici TaxID=56615 RepID=A0A5B0MJ80_PUCGR|nr:hypothetical protein PGTUg99_036081 [Puccinia graminis f. sp. tritici]